MKKLFLCLFLTVLLTVLFALPALALSSKEGPRLRAGDVNDDAAVISDAFIRDFRRLNERSDLRFTVLTRHFLGGADAQKTADALFLDEELTDRDVLLLLVIGEERYAVSAGSKAAKRLSDEQLSSLLASKLRPAFINERDYDAAAAQFCLAVASQYSRAEGTSFSSSDLFGANDLSKEQAAPQKSTDASLISSLMDQYRAASAPKQTDDDNGVSAGRIVLTAIVLLLIVRRRKRKGKAGLGLLGSLIAFKGIRSLLRHK